MLKGLFFTDTTGFLLDGISDRKAGLGGALLCIFATSDAAGGYSGFGRTWRAGLFAALLLLCSEQAAIGLLRGGLCVARAQIADMLHLTSAVASEYLSLASFFAEHRATQWRGYVGSIGFLEAVFCALWCAVRGGLCVGCWQER